MAVKWSGSEKNRCQGREVWDELTHMTRLELITLAADLDQGPGGRVERVEFGALRAFESSMAGFADCLRHGGLSSVAVGDLPDEFTIHFAQWARHVAHRVLMLLWSMLLV